MSYPTTSTNILGPDIPGNIATPASGYTSYFFNSSDSNRIWYKIDDGTYYAYSSGTCDPCLCEAAAKTMCSWNQALLDGTLTSVTYLTLINAGATFTCTNGSETWTVNIGNTPASSAIFTLPVYANDAAAGVGGLVTGQLYQTGGGVVMIKQ